ncbi:Uncharacterised protein [Segatella copri]|nr:Uncharacterised protein [Segatella copri]
MAGFHIVLASRIAGVGILYIIHKLAFFEEGIKKLFVLVVSIRVCNKCRYLSGDVVSCHTSKDAGCYSVLHGSIHSFVWRTSNAPYF